MSVAITSGYYGNGGTDEYVGKFIPEIWSGKLQVKFYDTTVLSEITNNDFEGSISEQGDKVKIRTVPSITINDYEKGETLASQVPTTSLVELLIDKGKYFQTIVDDVDEVQADLRLMDIFTNDASQQMKIAIDTQVLAGLAGAGSADNIGTTAGKISNNINLGASTGTKSCRKVTTADVISHVVELGQVLDEQNAPEDGRFLVVPAWFASRIKQSDLKDASITGDQMTPLRNGRLGMIDRFTVYVSNLLPTQASITDEDSGNSTATSVFAGTKDATTFASQFTRMETLRSTSTFGQLVRGLNVYGFKVVKPEALTELFCYPG
tara:strand:- start:4535 stop:5500 length:966 start_codon:yes stop_codon:yes gene_type:complete